MPSRDLSVASAVALAIFALTLIVNAAPASAQQERVLHSFYSNGRDGYTPGSSLITDSAGNLYGTAPVGGYFGGGIVFEVTPKTGGGWTSKTLHAFSGRGADGFDPTASLIFDAAGNLYGTTSLGGANGVGTVFELSPTTSGTWTETVLHSFGTGNSNDGQGPASALLLHASGTNPASLYGTTLQGGTNNLGTAFELTPVAGGGWTETVLHSFGSAGDGRYSNTALIVDAAGNLYGTTSAGGTYNFGTVFELTPAGDEKILHSFKPDGRDGVAPFGALVMDQAGNLYGTTNAGGTSKYGTVFEVAPALKSEKILYSFSGDPGDGENPNCELIFDASGNLYGTTTNGGARGAGTVFEMTPTANGWTEKVLHSFLSGNNSDGSFPEAGVTMDTLGNLYGTTYAGGSHDDGTVFAILH